MSDRDAGIQPSPTAEVPLGYKRTEIGVIPQEWELNTVRNLFYTLRNASNSRADLADSGEIYYIHYGDIHSKWDGVLDFSSDEVPYLKNGVECKADLLSDGDLIVADASEDQQGVGSSIEVFNLDSRSAIAGLHTIALRPMDCIFAPMFLGSLFNSHMIKDQLQGLLTGLKVFGISKRNIAQVILPLPPLPEQRAIAAALSDVDALIAALDDLIAKKRGIKQATMQQLLTGKTRLKGFSGPWEERRLGEIATITMGQSPSSAFYNLDGNGLPLIQGNADIEKRQSIERVWTMQANKRCAAGNILLTVRAPVGFVGIATSEVCLGRGVCGIQAHQNIDFLFHQLVLCEPQWKALEQGSTFTAANRNQVEQFNISIPMDGSEQRAIAEILSDMDAELDALEARREKTQQLKQGMMQQLLTGKVRLVTPEETP